MPATFTPVSAEIGPDGALERSDLRALLQRALERLPVALRTAVVLRDLQELSYQEIADQLDLPEGTVKSRINRGRLELARQVRRLQDKLCRPAGGPPAVCRAAPRRRGRTRKHA